MKNITDRLFLQHAKGMFSSASLARMYTHFLESEGRFRALQALSDREQKAIARGESADAMRMQDTWYDVWRDAPNHKAMLSALSPFTWVTYPVQVRHVREVHHSVPWHQDIGYMRLLGERGHRQVITCFIPLEPDPARVTTIEFADDNMAMPDKIYEHQSREGFGAGLPAEECTQRHHFNLARGDALVFGDFVLHRTYTPPGCEVERRSLEFRLIQPQDALPNKDYFDIETQSFIKTDEHRKVLAHA
jgi:hypothetical protein